jgi:hypothetical protein
MRLSAVQAIKDRAMGARETAIYTLDRLPNELCRFDLLRTGEREMPKECVKRLGIKLEPVQKPPPDLGHVIWSIRAVPVAILGHLIGEELRHCLAQVGTIK